MTPPTEMGLSIVCEAESVLQCVAVCCSVLQCAAVCCGVLQCSAVRGRDRHAVPRTQTNGDWQPFLSRLEWGRATCSAEPFFFEGITSPGPSAKV